jgi:hypothetical protein
VEDGGVLGGVMKTSRILIFATFLILIIPTASFPLILGPYTGKAIDSQTGEPIEGAIVLVFWEGHFPIPPDGYSTVLAAKLMYTDKAGGYSIPTTVVTLGLLSLYHEARLVIYQPGYQVHSDWQHAGPDPPSFKKIGNIVKLDRIPPNFDHKEHYEWIRTVLSHINDIGWEAPVWGTKLTWKKHIELNLRSGILGKEELLRRAEWERRRGEHQ